MGSDWAAMLMEREGPGPEGLGLDFWMAKGLPFEVRDRVDVVFETLRHLPIVQPLAVVADAGKTLAVNQALLDLVPGVGPEQIGRMWSRLMPGWPERARDFRRVGEQSFEEHLVGAGGERVWVGVSLGPLGQLGEKRAMAYVLFINLPNVETVDHAEVRRLRKSLSLLADIQSDYVVEVDLDGVMTFVSPSFCRAVGAREKELVGREFAARMAENERSAVAIALDQARRPPFCGTLRAGIAAEPSRPVEWQIEAVIGDGIVGLDLVGHPYGAVSAAMHRVPCVAAGSATGGAAAAAPGFEPTAPAPAPARPADPRLTAIAVALAGLLPGDEASLRALTDAVAAAAGLESVSVTLTRGGDSETAFGWRLPRA